VANITGKKETFKISANWQRNRVYLPVWQAGKHAVSKKIHTQNAV